MMKAYAGGWMPKAPPKRKKPAPPNVVTLPSRINRMNPSGIVMPLATCSPYELEAEMVCRRLAERALAY